MRYIALMMTAAVLATGVAGARGAAELHLPFDETGGAVAQDVSGNSRDGTVFGATWSGAGALGGALEFDKDADYVRVSDFSLNNEFSVAFWFKANDISGEGYQWLFSWGGLFASNSINIWLSEDGISERPSVLRTNINDFNDTNDPLGLDVLDAPNLFDGNWHHYALTVSSDDGANVYIDGAHAVSRPYGGDVINPGTDIFIAGRSDMYPTRYLNGGMDDVQIHSTALSAQEVAALVPEPMTLGLLALGGLALLRRRRR